MKMKENSWSASTIQIKQRWLEGLPTRDEILDTLLATKRGGANTSENELCDLLFYTRESSFSWSETK